jgi:hypothetical protein
MKLKYLATLSLAAFLFLSFGCSKADQGNGNNTNNGINKAMPTATPTAVVQTGEANKTDPAMKMKIETALKAKGFTDLTVDTSTSPATLRGTYPKAKLAEVMAAAMEANGGKPVQNQATGK